MAPSSTIAAMLAFALSVTANPVPQPPCTTTLVVPANFVFHPLGHERTVHTTTTTKYNYVDCGTCSLTTTSLHLEYGHGPVAFVTGTTTATGPTTVTSNVCRPTLPIPSPLTTAVGPSSKGFKRDDDESESSTSAVVRSSASAGDTCTATLKYFPGFKYGVVMTTWTSTVTTTRGVSCDGCAAVTAIPQFEGLGLPVDTKVTITAPTPTTITQYSCIPTPITRPASGS